jgi:hypothetical protein
MSGTLAYCIADILIFSIGAYTIGQNDFNNLVMRIADGCGIYF